MDRKAFVCKLARPILKEHEGVRTRPYNDHLGHCTVGVGRLLHLGPCTEDESRTIYTPIAIEAMLAEDIGRAYNIASRWVGDNFQHLSASWQLAFTLMAFQLGETRMKKFKLAQAAVQLLGSTDDIVAELENSKWAKQTPKRVDFIVNLLRHNPICQPPLNQP